MATRKVKKKKNKPEIKRLVTWLLGISAIAGVIFVFSLAFAVATTSIPQPSDVAKAQATVVYWADGETEIGRFGEFNRTDLPIDEIPLAVQYAVLAAEDREFYEHQGFSIRGISRAFINNIFTDSLAGGSTITQQYAKLAFLSTERTIIRKWKELVLAIKLETTSSKDKILENYLNTVYFGRGAYGVQSAALTFYGVEAKDLSVSQSAALAALIQAPSAISNPDNKNRWVNRWRYVVDGMVTQGWLTENTASVLLFPEDIPYQSQNKFGGTNGYLLFSIREEMLEKGYTENDLNLRGLKVVSTFEREAQSAIVAAVENEGPKENTEGLRIGIASVRPGTGEIVAMYGGPDYVKEPLNNATQAIAQAGSTFKPFALAAAFEQQISLDTLFNGDSPRKFGDYRVRNYSNRDFGEVNLLQATEQSINTPYVELGLMVGTDQVLDAALRAGIPADTPGLISDVTLVLGTASPHTLDLAVSYATFAARGIYSKPTTIKEIYAPNGGILYELIVENTAVFSTEVADEINFALRRVIRSGTGTNAQIGRPAAGKTGTTDENKSAWFVGYTPDLATAVMMAKDDENGNPISLSGTGGLRNVTGGSFPARMWRYYMSEALKNSPETGFAPRTNIGQIVETDPGISEEVPELVEPTPTEPLPTEPIPTETPTPTPTPTPTDTQTPTPSPAPTESVPPEELEIIEEVT
ncbi:MAG: transglycosylase domain-containing protein [Candidatus Nanopelagicales bacterium]